jgi:hypothetical protein
MAAFFTIDELAAALQMDIAAVDVDTANQLAELASDIVRDDLGGAGQSQQIDFQAGDTVTLYGDSGQIVVLPQKPVTAVGSVTLGGQLLDPNTYQWRDNGILYRVVYGGGQYADMQTWIWPFGVPVVVVYDHGYSPVPSLIKQVALELAAAAYLNPAMAVSQTAGPYSVSYTAQQVGMTLSPGQESLLDNYRCVEM